MGRGGQGFLKQAMASQNSKHFEYAITVGEVIDTNDSQQMGRIRVYCPAFGDSETMPVENLPWAMYASPFAGVNEFGARGTGEDQSDGPVAYGMWNVPKVGARVLVTCIDGNPSQRVWFAALFEPSFLTHTMPHGRFMYNDAIGSGKPEGPLTSTEKPINPLYNNQTQAFSGGNAPPRQSFEWRTRGADTQVSFVDPASLNRPGKNEISSVGDDRNVVYHEPDGDTIVSNQGYGKSRLEPYLEVESTDGINWDPQIYSWTTPGFHSISMHDRKDNCRIRLRTTGGSQIIMDDTNERIYISTAKGKSWVEIDEQGPIYIYSEQGFSVNGGSADINFSTEGSFRVNASKGIHLNSQDDIRATSSQGDMHLQTQAGEIHISSQSTLHLLTNGEGRFSATSNLHLHGGGTLNAQSGSTMNLLAGAMILQTGSQIHFNGPQAANAENANPADPSFVPSIKPSHEPWARSYTASDNTISPEYPYNDPKVGRGSDAHNLVFERNPLWHR